MHRSCILWLLCVTMASACIVTTKKEPTVSDKRTARREPEPPPPPRHDPPPHAGHWDSRGWTLVGEEWIRGRSDENLIRIGRQEGKFTKLMLVVVSGDVQLNEVTVEYVGGARDHHSIRHTFREGSRTRAIDLRGDARLIQRVELKAHVIGGDQAKVQLWGREA